MAQFVALRAANRSARVRVPAKLWFLPPANPSAVESDTGGTLSTGSYFYKIVAINATGHSLPSAQVSITVGASVTTASAALTWSAVTGATSYQIWRGTATNAEDHFQTSSTNSFTDAGATGTAGTIPSTVTGYISGNAPLSFTNDTIVDLDDATVRRALAHHQAIGQWWVSAANTNAHSGVGGALTSLPSNS